MIAAMKHHHHDYGFPAERRPPWADAVERWPQLDAYAFGLPALFHEARPSHRPDLILLASAEASNQTDFSFVQAGATSPAKFVHTLPNSRSAALLQVMNWSGPLLCLQDDPHTLAEALLEAFSFAAAEQKRVWLFSIERRTERAFTAHLFDVSTTDMAAPWTLSRPPTPQPTNVVLIETDRDLSAALQTPGLSTEFMLFNGLQMTFKDPPRG